MKDRNKNIRNTDEIIKEEQLIEKFFDRDDRALLKTFSKYIKHIPLSNWNYRYQCKYAELLKYNGNIETSIKHYKRLYEKSMNIRAAYGLIDCYLYLNEYDKALTIMNEVKESGKLQSTDKKFYLYQAELYRHFQRKEVIDFSKNARYYTAQIYSYNQEHFLQYNSIYFNPNIVDMPSFNLDIEILSLTEEVLQVLDNAVKSTDSGVVDYYYFEYEQPIGVSEHDQPLTGLKVVTIKNSKQILKLQPYDVKDPTKILVVNKVPSKKATANNYEEIKRTKQIEKFNRRYNRV